MSYLPPRRPGTRPDQPHSVGKRQRGPNLYAHSLPLLLSPPSLTQSLAPNFLNLTNITNPHIQGTYDASSGAVWVVGMEEMEVLWRRGFWGKGSLSRSEPTWVQRARNRRAVELDKDANMKLTAEELTAKRRIERRELKILKAREKLVPSPAPTNASLTSTPDTPDVIDTPSDPVAPRAPAPKLTRPEDLPFELAAELAAIENLEHMQMMKEEALFLSWALGCLDVHLAGTEEMEREADGSLLPPLQPVQLYQLFLIPRTSSTPRLHPSNPFLISYVAFHHFRSHGWVVRSGIKFCTDFVLYGVRGPVGGHAEFAVCVIPTYEDPEDDPLSGTEPTDLSQDRRSWHWFSTVNRVCSGVKKTLVFAYVTVPSSKRCTEDVMRNPACMSMYSVREVVVRRFLPSRMRD